MSSGLVLSMCDRTGVMVEPWLEAGYECWIVDLQHEAGVHRDGRLVRVGGDVSRWLPPRDEYRIVFGFPPCTDLAISGARWFKDKGLSGLAGAVELVEAVRDRCEWSGAPWMIENPVGTLSSYWRKPDYMFDPCDFGGWVGGDAYTKRTCLWTGNGFRFPPHRPVEPVEGSRMHKLPPTDDRGDLRSVTPPGFARAVFEANEHPQPEPPRVVDVVRIDARISELFPSAGQEFYVLRPDDLERARELLAAPSAVEETRLADGELGVSS